MSTSELSQQTSAKGGTAGNGTTVVIPPYSVGFRDGDYRTIVELQPPSLPWPLTYYFARITSDTGDVIFVSEGSEHGAAVPDIDAEAAMAAAEHLRHHDGDYEDMARLLCVPTPENRRRAAEIYSARILRWRRVRRSLEDRLRIRDTYRACVEQLGRQHGATQATVDKLYLERKAVRRGLEECVRRGEMARDEISWRRTACRAS